MQDKSSVLPVFTSRLSEKLHYRSSAKAQFLFNNLSVDKIQKHIHKATFPKTTCTCGQSQSRKGFISNLHPLFDTEETGSFGFLCSLRNILFSYDHMFHTRSLSLLHPGGPIRINATKHTGTAKTVKFKERILCFPEFSLCFSVLYLLCAPRHLKRELQMQSPHIRKPTSPSENCAPENAQHTSSVVHSLLLQLLHHYASTIS